MKATQGSSQQSEALQQALEEKDAAIKQRKQSEQEKSALEEQLSEQVEAYSQLEHSLFEVRANNKHTLATEQSKHQAEMQDAFEQFQESLSAEQSAHADERQALQAQIDRLEAELSIGKEKAHVDYRSKLSSLFGKYAPEKIGSIDKLLRQNKGTEKELLNKLEAQYCPPPEPDKQCEQCAELLQRVGKLQRVDEELAQHLQTIEVQNKQLTELQAIADRVPKLEQEADGLRSQLSSLRAVKDELLAVQSACGNTSAMSGEVTRLTKELKAAEKKLVEADRESERYRKELDKARRAADEEADKFVRKAEREAEKRVKEAEAVADKRVREAEKEIHGAGKHAAQRLAERNALEEEITRLQDVEKKKVSLDQDNHRLRAEILKMGPETSPSKKAKTAKQLEDAQKLVQQAQAQASTSDRRVVELEAEVAGLEEQCRNLQKWRDDDGKRAQSAPKARPSAIPPPKTRRIVSTNSKIQVVGGVRKVLSEQM